ncbi:MAG: asparagine synthetase B, partial [Clostridia bacterium]|nr:asparagine synthetase B [Clostridia bacterium]
DFVHSVTASASAFGMQARFPFLDSAVYESARTLPDSMKIGPDGTKLALRLAAEGVVPTDAYKRKKLGFPVPLKEWMKEDLYYNEIKKAFTSETAKKFFKEKAILKLLDDHRNEVCDCYKKIWTIYTFIVWYDLYFN